MKKYLLSILLIGITLFSILYYINNNQSIAVSYTGEFSTYSVSKGETLWTIANSICEDKDIREVIYIIKQDNNLEKSSLSIGQELKLRIVY